MNRGSDEILLGMSGGVDSSAAAWYLKRDGHQVVGVTLLFHEGKAEEEKLARAKAIAGQLGIEHEVIDLREPYASKIESWYAEEWRLGREPDPVVRSTAELMFPALMQRADELGIRRIATGHYARIAQDEFGIDLLPYQLQRGQEKAKGQSYVLARLGQDALSRVEFPNGGFPKSWIRRDAMRAGLMRFVQVEDDQDVPVFFEGRGRAAWLEGPGGLKSREGAVVNVVNERRIGRHGGLHRYEIGQEFGQGLFVIAKDLDENLLLVGPKSLARVEMCMLGDVHWTSIESPTGKRTCRAQFKQGTKPIPCKIVMTQRGLVVAFTETAYGVCPGQTMVFYSDDLVLGCGTIIA